MQAPGAARNAGPPPCPDSAHFSPFDLSRHFLSILPNPWPAGPPRALGIRGEGELPGGCDGFYPFICLLGSCFGPEGAGRSKGKFVSEEHKLQARVKAGRDQEGTELEPELTEKETDQTRRCRNCSQAPGREKMPASTSHGPGSE